ncbi:MAG: hypothetical protein WKG01_21985 [Kofleriaceae bacterium]
MARYPDPRILICALAPALAPLVAAARAFAAETRFEVDESYSSDEADDRMERSFDVCWDRVVEDAYDEADEAAVAGHGAVMYVISEPVPRDRIVKATGEAVRLIAALLAGPGTAAKIENAGIAHGVSRWRALAEGVRATRDAHTLGRVVRDAVLKPIGGERYYESIGLHLAGIPEVYVPLESVKSEREAVRRMQAVADELLVESVDVVVARHGASLDRKSQYESGFEFKINPWGVVKLPTRAVSAAIRPSRPGL